MLPKSVYFIIGNEFSERFAYYGMKAILFLYLKSIGLSDKDSTASVHGFNALAYLCPLIGAILADSYLGRYKTILYLSIVYCMGTTLLCLSSISNQSFLVFVALGLIALGTGGIKPCVSAFGADQITHSFSKFFSMFYFSINAGSLISMLLVPIIRKTSCLGSETCYPIAFGLPAIVMCSSILIFYAGSSLYHHQEPQNVFFTVFDVIKNAFKFRSRTEVSFLDRARFAGCDEDLISNLKKFFKVLKIFIPLPMFWALYDQMGTRWTSQAQNMNPYFIFRIDADQMAVINTILVLSLIPVSRIFYKKVKITLINRMICGMILACLSFLCAAFLESKVQKHQPFCFNQQSCFEESIHVLWQIPQYILMTLAEIFFSVSGLEFAYLHSPTMFKSLCQAAWLLTVAVGNIYVVLITQLQLEPVFEFLFYVQLLIICTFFVYAIK